MFWIRFLFVFLFCSNIYSQISEINFHLGANNAITDIGNESIIYPNSFSFGLSYKENVGKRYLTRIGLMFNRLYGDDKNSKYEVKRDRGYSFTTNLYELTFGVDISFWEFDHLKKDYTFPYLIFEVGAVSYSYMNPTVKTDLLGNITIEKNKEKDFNICIPFGMGIKKKKGLWNYCIEYKMVITLTDNIDGRYIKDNSIDKNFYNINYYNNFDWYNSISFVIGYSFGRKKCFFCIDSYDNEGKRGLR